MDWVPVIFITFKVLVIGIGMFFAIKWHYDKGREVNGKEKQRAVLRAGGKIAAIFVLALVALLLLTFGLARLLGMNMTFP